MAEVVFVEIDIGDGIQAVAAQENVRFIQQGGFNGEGAAVFPIGFGDPDDFEFVIGHKRVGDFPEGEQVGVHATRDGRGQPVFGSCLAKLPGSR